MKEGKKRRYTKSRTKESPLLNDDQDAAQDSCGVCTNTGEGPGGLDKARITKSRTLDPN